MERLKENNASPIRQPTTAKGSMHVSIPKAFITRRYVTLNIMIMNNFLKKIKENTSLIKAISPIIKQWNRKGFALINTIAAPIIAGSGYEDKHCNQFQALMKW
ncbi:Uncharacterized protein BM_BM13079 [Brugia malayi]|uniref:Bm13079 n=1 Tax=Brugia malayi TaxID=6279 RepID=A0A0K0IWT4_BRUMA|nr:Uncharacterized protein BM_BM13079 [Brugia malayi]CDP94883.1 Bm13079 [Brugia malayi]VIO87023.1 Uncharacterized protein BM_BM13079 [Brugia malayi]